MTVATLVACCATGAQALTYTADFSGPALDSSLGFFAGSNGSMSSGGGSVLITLDEPDVAGGNVDNAVIYTNFQIAGDYVATVTADVSHVGVAMYPLSYFDGSFCNNYSGGNIACISNYNDSYDGRRSSGFVNVSGLYTPLGNEPSGGIVMLRIARQGSTVTESIALVGGGYMELATYTDLAFSQPAAFTLGAFYNGTIGGPSQVRYSDFSISYSAAPEPASWALMLGGFGAIGGALRSRRRAAVSFESR